MNNDNEASYEIGSIDIYAKYSHYQTLGGWLLFVVITNAFSIVSLLIRFISLSLQNPHALQLQLQLYKWPQYMLSILSTISSILIITTVVSVLLNLVFIILIVKRNPAFLKFLELTFIINIVLFIGILIYVKSLDFPGNFMSAVFIHTNISGLLAFVIRFLIWTAYYRKSLRVRVYIGSDAYLRKSIFSRRAKESTPPYEEL